MTLWLDYSLTNYHRTGLLTRVRETLRLWRKRIREREELSRMRDVELQDMGISRTNAMMEVSKPFWRE